jgi:hypothetical protein
MQYVGMALCGLGGLVILVGAIMLLVAAFSESVLWGLGSLFVPFVGLIFIIMHWDVSKRPVLVKLAGMGVFGLGLVLVMAFTEKGR